MTDAELREFRRFIDEQLPEGSAHMSDADVAGLRKLVDLAGDPTAAAGLIAEIDSLLNGDNAGIDDFFTAGGLGGVRFDTAEEARAWLRQFRAFFTGDGKDDQS